MDNLRFVMLCSFFIKAIFVISVTLAAIKFQNYHLLWWYLLATQLGWEYKRENKE